MAQRIIKQKAIFLDRDGTLIRQCADIVRPSQLRILKNAPEGLRLMRELGYRLLVISNQPVIGKGFIDHKGVTELHDVLNMKLAKRGGHVDAFYVCPHRHWDTCSCRKPKLGLVRRGIQRFRISARDSFFIGDSFRDVQTGKNAKMATILIKANTNAREKDFFDVNPDYVARDLLAAARLIQGLHRG